MTKSKHRVLRRQKKSNSNKPNVIKSSSLASIKKSNSKNKKICIKRNTKRNIYSKQDKLIPSKNKSPTRKKQHQEEVKNESKSKKSKITKAKCLSNKVEDEKLLISPIVLLEILPIDRRRKNVIKTIEILNSTENPCQVLDNNSLKKSSHINLRKYTSSKTDFQNIVVTEKQICVNRIESDDNEQIDSSKRTKLQITNYPALELDNNVHNLKSISSEKEIFVEPEILCCANSDVKSSDVKESLLEDISGNCEEQTNCKDKNELIVKEIVNNITEDDHITTEKQHTKDFILNEIIQKENINKLNEQNSTKNTIKVNDTIENNHTSVATEYAKDFILNEMIQKEYRNEINGESCIDNSENNKEKVFDSKEDDNMVGISDNESIIGSCESKYIETQEMNLDNIENDTDDNDNDDDEEIIFYYVNSDNEIVKKIDVKKRSSEDIEEEKANCIETSNSEVVISDVINEPVLTKQDKYTNSYQVETNIKEDKTLNDMIKMKNHTTKEIDQSIINKEQKNINEILPIVHNFNDKSIDIIHPINIQNTETAITDKKEVSKTVCSAMNNSKVTISDVNINESELAKQDKYVNDHQPESNIKENKTFDDEVVVIKKHTTKNINESIITEHENMSQDMHITDELNANSININQPISTQNAETITIKRTVNATKYKTIKININLIHKIGSILNVGKLAIGDGIDTVNINKIIEKDKIMNVTQSIVTDRDNTVNITKPVVTDKGENVKVDQCITTEQDKISDINKSVLTENSETININQCEIIEKDKFINKNQVEIIKKDTSINDKPSALIDKDKSFALFQKSDTINEVVVTESDKNAELNQNTISEIAANKKVDESFIIENKEKKIDTKQSFLTQNEQNINAHQLPITENNEPLNVDQPLIIESDKNIENDQPLVTEENKITNVTQPVTTKESTIDKINESPIIEINQDTTSNMSKHSVVEENQCNTVEMNQPIINETNLLSEIKIEDVDLEDSQINIETNLFDNTNANISDRDVCVNRGNVANECDVNTISNNTICEIIKEEDITESNSENDEVNNQDIIMSSSFSTGNNALHQANYDNERHNAQTETISESESASNGSMDRSNAMFINFMETYQKMRKDMNAANSLLTLNGESNDVDIGTEILHITDDSDNEVPVAEKNTVENAPTIQTPKGVAMVKLPMSFMKSLNLANPVNPIRRKILLPNGGAVISASRLYGCGDGISIKQGSKKRRFPCSKCKRVYSGEASFKKHKCKSNRQGFLHCIFCSKTVIQRRSLVNHLKKFHKTEVMGDDIKNIVNSIMKDADFKKDKIMPSLSICIPAFVKLFCNKCGKIYNRIHEDYYRQCGTCKVPLLIFCQRCNKRYVVSPRIASHLDGSCDVGQPIQCPYCNFFVNQRHQLHKHIEDIHRQVTFSDNIHCTKGCGRKFHHTLGMRRHEKYCGTKPNLRCKFCPYKTRHRSAIKMHTQQHVLRNDSVMVEQNYSDNDSCVSIDSAVTVDETNVRSLMEAFCTKCDSEVPMPKTNITTCSKCKTRLSFSCSMCYMLQSRSRDYRHVRVHVIRCHADKIYKCSSCSRRFSLYYDYNYHQANCDKNRRYQCELCPYKSNLPRGLQGHMKRIHPNGVLEFHHCLQCYKKFNSKDTLQKHVRVFCSNKPNFFCAHCSFCTRSKFSLTRHIQNKHSEIFGNCIFKCLYCDKVYNNLYAHDTHVENCRTATV